MNMLGSRSVWALSVLEVRLCAQSVCQSHRVAGTFMLMKVQDKSGGAVRRAVLWGGHGNFKLIT